MRRFLIRRLVYSVVTLFAATAIVFGLSRMVGDPLTLFAPEGGYGRSDAAMEALSVKWGLDRPLVVQYFIWIGNALRGDLGRSMYAQQDVWRLMIARTPATLELGFSAWLLATLVGVPLGVLSAVKRATGWDYVGRFIGLFGQATPVFWLGIVSILVFAVFLGWLPAGGRGEGGLLNRHLILPVLVLGLQPAAAYLRLSRSAMLEVLDSEYVKLARAKGVGNWTIIWKHAFKNMLIPPITLSALVMAGLVTGTVIVEAVFAWPGLGRMAVQAVTNNDFPLMTGSVLMFAVIYVALNFVADMLYLYVDPRIRYE